MLAWSSWSHRARQRVLHFGFLLLAGCALAADPAVRFGPRPDGHYDNSTHLVDPSRMDLARVATSVVTLRTETTFRGPEESQFRLQMMGIGVVMEERFVLTVEHLVAQHELVLQTPLGPIEPPVKKMAEKTFILWEGEAHPLRPIYKNRADDVVLFELPKGVRPPSFPHPLGDSDELRVGNFIYVVGNPLNLGVNVREGIVSALKAPRMVSRIEAKEENAFMVSNGLMPGDSGAPVIAIRDGRYELVGLCQGTFLRNTRMGWVIRINVIRNLLRTARARLEEERKAASGVVPVLKERGGGKGDLGAFQLAGCRGPRPRLTRSSPPWATPGASPLEAGSSRLGSAAAVCRPSAGMASTLRQGDLQNAIPIGGLSDASWRDGQIHLVVEGAARLG